jgi:hypothetical protein
LPDENEWENEDASDGERPQKENPNTINTVPSKHDSFQSPRGQMAPNYPAFFFLNPNDAGLQQKCHTFRRLSSQRRTAIDVPFPVASAPAA